MEKTRTTVKIAGRDYTIVGHDSSEHVQQVAEYVNRRMGELALATHLPPAQLAVLTAVNATDDMMKSREQVLRLQRENRRLRELLHMDGNDEKA
ncbi:MAG: cell division protein ZapA [Clostridia bacterium]|nr:cell division protein ZapA [Clostridia bacterium]